VSNSSLLFAVLVWRHHYNGGTSMNPWVCIGVDNYHSFQPFGTMPTNFGCFSSCLFPMFVGYLSWPTGKKKVKTTVEDLLISQAYQAKVYAVCGYIAPWNKTAIFVANPTNLQLGLRDLPRSPFILSLAVQFSILADLSAIWHIKMHMKMCFLNVNMVYGTRSAMCLFFPKTMFPHVFRKRICH
jgi:hypothetical protein